MSGSERVLLNQLSLKREEKASLHPIRCLKHKGGSNPVIDRGVE
jgi:hypothetical protein